MIIQYGESAKKKITKICLHQCTPVGFLYYQQKVKPRFGYYFFVLRMFKRKIYNSEFIKLWIKGKKIMDVANNLQGNNGLYK